MYHRHKSLGLIESITLFLNSKASSLYARPKILKFYWGCVREWTKFGHTINCTRYFSELFYVNFVHLVPMFYKDLVSTCNRGIAFIMRNLQSLDSLPSSSAASGKAVSCRFLCGMLKIGQYSEYRHKTWSFQVCSRFYLP
jgi:hypothetical protein